MPATVVMAKPEIPASPRQRRKGRTAVDSPIIARKPIASPALDKDVDPLQLIEHIRRVYDHEMMTLIEEKNRLEKRMLSSHARMTEELDALARAIASRRGVTAPPISRQHRSHSEPHVELTATITAPVVLRESSADGSKSAPIAEDPSLAASPRRREGLGTSMMRKGEQLIKALVAPRPSEPKPATERRRTSMPNIPSASDDVVQGPATAAPGALATSPRSLSVGSNPTSADMVVASSSPTVSTIAPGTASVSFVSNVADYPRGGSPDSVDANGDGKRDKKHKRRHRSSQKKHRDASPRPSSSSTHVPNGPASPARVPPARRSLMRESILRQLEAGASPAPSSSVTSSPQNSSPATTSPATSHIHVPASVTSPAVRALANNSYSSDRSLDKLAGSSPNLKGSAVPRKLVNTKSKAVIKEPTHWIRCLQFNNQLIAYGCLNKSDIIVFDLTSGSFKRSLKGHAGVIYCLQLNDSILMSGSGDGCVKIWDMDKAVCTKTVEAHTSSGVLCLHQIGGYLVTGATDTTVKLWEYPSCKPLRTMNGHSGSVWCVALSPELGQIVSGSEDRSITVWDLQSGALLRSFGSQSAYLCLALQGAAVVAGAEDGSLQLWDTETGALQRTLREHTGPVECVQVSGVTVVSGSFDKTIKLWDLSAPKPAAVTLKGHSLGVYCLQFDNNRIVSGGEDGHVRVWPLKEKK